MIDYKKEYIGELEDISQDIDTTISKVESIKVEELESEESEELSGRLRNLITAFKDLELIIEDIEYK
jgi:hypothetical protein